MVICEKNNFRLDFPEQVTHLNDVQKAKLQETEESSEINFIIPSTIKSNRDKQVYKIGWLTEFLKLLYPDKKMPEICEIMSKRYDVFLSRRQIDRCVKKFLEDK